MGLDQCAYAKEHGTEVQQDVATWRKHPNLQGYMERLWRSRDNQGEFNCVSVELSEQDIRDLATAIVDGDLPETQGCFFGSDADKYYQSQDLEFCAKALDLLKSGSKVYYSSWW